MSGVFTDLETSDYRCTVLGHDMDLYGWVVTWEFACYVTDRLIAREFGPVPVQEQLCPPPDGGAVWTDAHRPTDARERE